jgi:autotransporter-associated beta strand protein
MKVIKPSILSHSIIALLALCPAIAKAALVTYVTDSSTLHLWHMDAVGSVPDLGTNVVNLGVLGGGATLGNAAYPGFGSALSTFDGGPNTTVAASVDAYLSAKTLANGTGDNTTITTFGPGGAFTFEALIRIDFDPLATVAPRTASYQIISGENDSDNRQFQFRFDPVGTNPNADGFTTALNAPALELFNAAGENKILPLPTSGLDAVQQGAWYHVALSYTGAQAVANNLTFYWTKLDDTRLSASVLGTKTLNNDLPAANPDFAIGNSGRGQPATQNFVGLIDEVRISGVGRGAADFIFTAPTGSFWNVDADGAWDATVNWTLGTPNAVAAVANFGGGGTVLTAPRTIILTGTQTVGALVFKDALNGYTLAPGVNGSLKLDNGPEAAIIFVGAGVQVIDVPISLPAVGANFSVAGLNDKLVITNTITGDGLLTKSGSGTLQIGNGSTSGSLPANDVVISLGTLAFNRSDDIVIANGFSGGGAIAQNGPGKLMLSGLNSHFGGNVVNAGTLVVADPSALGSSTGPLKINAGALDANGFQLNVGTLTGTTNGTISDQSTIPGGTVLTVNQTTAGTYAGTIQNGPVRTLALTKAGSAALTLTGSNSFTGSTTVVAGSLIASSFSGPAFSGDMKLGAGTADSFLITTVGSQLAPGKVVNFDNGAFNAKWDLRGTAQTVGGLESGTGSALGIVQNQDTALQAITATLTIDTATDHAFSGVIRSFGSKAGNQVNLVKNGVGTQELRNVTALPYDFGTAVINEGKLVFNLSGANNTLGTSTSITVNAGGTLGLAGDFSMTRPVGGGGTVEKSGAGIVTVTTTLAHSGETHLLGGTLNVAGSISGSNAVLVSSGATLMGIGQVNTLGGNAIFASGAKLAPGASGGILTFNLAGTGLLDISLAVTPSNSAALVFNLGTARSSIALHGGNLKIGAGLLEFNDFAFTDTGGLSEGSYVLFDTDAPILDELGEALGANLSGTVGTFGEFTGTLALADGGNDLVLNVVPEPGSGVLLLGGLAAALGIRRRETKLRAE